MINASLAFVQKMDFSGGHVFTYSERPGTAAAEMPSQVHYPIRKERNARMRAILAESAQEYKTKFINTTLLVLWEKTTQVDAQTWELKGLTDNYLRVSSTSQTDLWNKITSAHLVRLNNDGLFGELIP